MKLAPNVLAAALLLAANAAHAGARDQLNAFTKGLKGLDGQFSQQVFDPRGKQKEASTGRVAVSAPRLFRWEYVKPYPQLIVADGKTVWVYDPDLQQASKRPQGVEEASSPLAILLDPGKLGRIPVSIEYVAAVDPDTLKPVETVSGPTLLAIAARVGGTRLIDNIVVSPP